MCSFKLIFFIIFLLNIYLSNSLISDKRLCMNTECSVPISNGKTLLRYISPDPQILSFTANQDVTVFSKEAGSRNDLWGVEINGKRGYIPKNMVRERNMLAKGKPTVVVDTEPLQTQEVPVVKSDENAKNVEPNKAKQSYEVVDGTTLYLDSNPISPSSTESPILSTASPVVSQEAQNSEAETSTEELDSSEVPPIQSNKNTEEKTKTQASIVEGVISAFKNLMNEDALPKDDEDTLPEEDDDDDEDDNDDEITAEDEEGTDEEREIKSELVKENTDTNNAEVKETSDSNLSANTQSTENLKEVNIEQKGNKETQERNDDTNTSVDDSSTKEHSIGSNIVEKTKDAKTPEEDSSMKVQTTIPTIFQKKETEEYTKPEIPGILPKIEETKNTVEAIREPTVNSSVKTETEENVAVETKENVAVETPGILPEIKETKDSEEIGSTKEQTISSNVSEGIETLAVKDGNEIPEVIMKKKVAYTTTEPSVDVDEAIPIVSSEDVTPNPIEFKQYTNSFSPAVESSIDKKSEISNDNLMDQKTSYQKIEDLVGSYETKQENPIAPHIDSNSEENLREDISSKNQEEIVQKDPPSKESKLEPTLNFSVNTNNENVKLDSRDENQLPDSLDNGRENNLGNNESYDQNPGLPLDNVIDTLQNNGVPIDNVFGNNLRDEDQDKGELVEEKVLIEESSMFSGMFSFFGSSESKQDKKAEAALTPISNENEIFEELIKKPPSVQEDLNQGYCSNNEDNCDKYNTIEENSINKLVFSMNSDILLYLGTTAIACIIFLFIYMLVDKSNREAPLVEKINKLEKELMITLKEKEVLEEGTSAVDGNMSTISNLELDIIKQRLQESEITRQSLEMQIDSLQKSIEEKEFLEEQIETLEKELETSTEVGMELNRIISEMLDPTNGSEKLKENMEQLQRQLLEQKGIISDMNKALSDKETENADLLNELSTSRRKTKELQSKLDEIVDQILKIEKERDQQVKILQEELVLYQQKFNEESMRKEMLSNEVQVLKTQLLDAQRKADLKIREYQNLKDSLNGIKSIKNDKEALHSLLDATSIKAELEHLKIENESYAAHLKQEEAAKTAFEKRCIAVMEENAALVKKYQESDKEKVEATMKLEVLNNYFKKKEEELQSELIKYKSIWDAKEGEATSTTERIKMMSEEIENYKSQNETLKQEIISQEIDLKSQISMLEKKVHDNWVTSRHMERKLEDAKHEAAQLRNRLTLRERSIIDERMQNRLQSPMDQNGELTLSPPPIESPASPSMLYGGRDHITKSPPLPGLPPFLPPPPGAPFMPPPIPGIPFMPPPPSMFPGDHRPPPLGRMSSPPPLNSRYSPDTSAFSPYDRNTPSPPYDSEYGASPPSMRGYSPYSRDDRREYKRPMHASNGRNHKGSLVSSGSDHSNDSLGKGNRKMV